MRKVKRPLLVTLWIGGITIIGLIVFELVCGLSVTRGFQKIPVVSMYVMNISEDKNYLSIDIPEERLPFNTMRVKIEEVKLKVDPSISDDIVTSSTDSYIWGNRWPWVQEVTLTLKNEEQREGFNSLLKGERLSKVKKYTKDGMCFGINKYGQLMYEGRILQY